MKSTVHVGGWDLGVRSGSLEIDAMLRRLLPGRWRAGLDPADNYSLSVERTEAGTTVLPTLFRGHQALLRSRAVPVLVAGLLANLAAHEFAARDDLMWVDAEAVVTRDGRAVLASAGHRRPLPGQFRALQRVGLRYHPVPGVAVDPATGELVVAALAVDPAAGAELRSDAEVSRTLVPPGRYPISGWALWGPGDSGRPVSGAQAVLRAMALVSDLDRIGSQRALDALAVVFTNARALSVTRTDADVLAGVRELADQS